MNKARYSEVREAALKFAHATENGTRNIEKKTQNLVAEWVKRNCREQKKNSRFIVHLATYNYGTRRWSDYDKVVEVEEFAPEILRETDKSFIIDHSYGKKVINKDCVIGWLSK